MPPVSFTVMFIYFYPLSNELGQEHGEFRLDLVKCMRYLREMFEKYRINQDGALLTWFYNIDTNQPTTSSITIPPEFEGRARFLVEQLWAQSDACEISCRTCNREYTHRSLHQQDWDESTEIEGIRVGASGFKIVCPSGHNLIFICCKLY
jgi:hypothetical protein